MRTVSIQEVKRRLSRILSAVEAGERFMITRHGKPIAVLGAVDPGLVHIGSRFGSGGLEVVLDAPTRGHYLAVLREDRSGER